MEKYWSLACTCWTMRPSSHFLITQEESPAQLRIFSDLKIFNIKSTENTWLPFKGHSSVSFSSLLVFSLHGVNALHASARVTIYFKLSCTKKKKKKEATQAVL